MLNKGSRCFSKRLSGLLALLALVFCGVLGSLFPTDAFAQAKAAALGSRYSIVRQHLSQLPTGCQLGWGPQFQSFDGHLGRKVVIGNREFIDFNPVRVCKAAAKICLSQLSGQSCCDNACRQHIIERPRPKTNEKGEKTDTSIFMNGFIECTKRCPGVPTFNAVKVDDKGLEAPVKFVNMVKKRK